MKEHVAMDLLEEQFSDQKLNTFPNLNYEPEILKIKTREDEIENLKYQIEKLDHENILKSPKIDNQYHKKNFRQKESITSFH